MSKRVDLSSMDIPRARKGEATPVADPSLPARAAVIDRPRVQAQAPAAQPDVVSAAALHMAPPSRAAGAEEGGATAAPAREHDPEDVEGEVMGQSLMPRKARTRGEPRSPITTRLTFSMQDRLFRASTLTGRTQQALIEDALDALLKKLKV